MSLAPFFPSPFSDFSWILAPGFRVFNPNSLCAKLQMKYIDCIEAYGLKNGREKCADIIYDFEECSRETFQKNRRLVIRQERMKQYRSGKLDKPFDEHPPIDSYFFLL